MPASHPDPAIAVAGDWHGDAGWASGRILSLGTRGVETVLHVGDFGLWPGTDGARYLSGLDRACRRAGITLMVTPGNHDDWGLLSTRWADADHQADDGRPLPIRVADHISVLPRGWRWEMGGRTFVSLGGAPSLDRAWRTEGVDWWPQEMMTDADVERTIADGYADVMITHDAPGPPWCVPAVAEILANNPMGWSIDALADAAVGRDRVTRAVLGVAPRLLVHGHYHVADEATVRLPGADHETVIWSLGAQRDPGNIRLLDQQLS